MGSEVPSEEPKTEEHLAEEARIEKTPGQDASTCRIDDNCSQEPKEQFISPASDEKKFAEESTATEIAVQDLDAISRLLPLVDNSKERKEAKNTFADLKAEKSGPFEQEAKEDVVSGHGRKRRQKAR